MEPRLEPPQSAEPEDGSSIRLRLDRLLDRLDAFRVLSERDEAKALAELESLGLDGQVESEMMFELSADAVLAHPDRFVEAHGAVMKALEVLDRNGKRRPTLRVGGPLRPVAAIFVLFVVGLQVDGYQRKVLGRIGDIYRRREAQTIIDSAEHVMLRRARKQVDRIRMEAGRGGVALTGLLLGGAALSVLSAAVSSVLDAINAHWWAFAATVSLFVGLALGAFWVMLHSAAITRRRIRITLDAPLQALYETVGSAGSPPSDPTRQYTLYSLIALTVGWIVVPVAVGLLLVPD